MRKIQVYITVGLIVNWLMICCVFAQENDSLLLNVEEIVELPVIVPPAQTTQPPLTTPVRSTPVQQVAAPEITEDLPQPVPDTVAVQPVYITKAYGEEVDYYIINHPLYHLHDEVLFTPTQLFVQQDKDELFYVVCGMFLFLGVLRVGFPKYFGDLFTAFSRFSFRQAQMREQLQQAGMTTLLYNIFFTAVAALYIYLLIDPLTNMESTLLMAVCLLSVGFIYVAKFFVLKLAGWMFNSSESADSYIYIVFLINKVAAVILVPCILVIAFADDWLRNIVLTISLFLIGLLIIYRFMLAYYSIRSSLKVNILHLILYVIGFEIIPVLVIYKMLTDLLQRSL